MNLRGPLNAFLAVFLKSRLLQMTQEYEINQIVWCTWSYSCFLVFIFAIWVLSYSGHSSPEAVSFLFFFSLSLSLILRLSLRLCALLASFETNQIKVIKKHSRCLQYISHVTTVNISHNLY